MIDKIHLTTVILCGGRSNRMNGEDKGLILLKNKEMISYVVDVVKKSSNRLLISANRNINKYQTYGEVIVDELINFQGPLAGILRAIQSVNTDYLLICSCDTPLLHKTIVQRLIKAMDNNNVDICVANDGNKIHPTIAIIKTELEKNLLDFIASGQRKLGTWIKQNNFFKVDCSDYLTAFTNINTYEDFDKLKSLYSDINIK